jgi:hypothetical protein
MKVEISDDGFTISDSVLGPVDWNQGGLLGEADDWI